MPASRRGASISCCFNTMMVNQELMSLSDKREGFECVSTPDLVTVK